MNLLSRYWWLVVLRGVLAILFGLAAFLWPGLTWLVLILLFGSYALVDGAFSLVMGFVSIKNEPRWWAFVLEGIVSILAGLIALFQPELTALILLYVIATWAIVTGVLEIAAAIRLRREIENEWLLGLAGAASILVGVLLFLQPEAGSLAVVWTIGAYALLFGVLWIALGLRLRNLGGPTPVGMAPST